MTPLALPHAAATRIVFVRHGEPHDSVRGRCYGRLDVGLSARGRKQVRRTQHLLSEVPFTTVYSSPRRRALESAGLLAVDQSRVTVDDRLREIDFGAFEGLTYEDVARQFPEKYEEWMNRPTEVVFPGGETFGAMAARVGDALDDLLRTHAGQSILTVSHGGVNRIVLAAALGLDASRIFRLDQAYACVNVIDYFAHEPVVRLVNGVA